jgi:hypothetical protein
MILGTTLGSENDRKIYFFNAGWHTACLGRADLRPI